ncbi:MAG: hypothetical protein IPJ49_27245 [Candidatus Obscuribacter sp.]|nr:hypothetical protein [Candidatus Obscuribacter sp.]
MDICPSGTIVNNPSTRTATRTREALILSNKNLPGQSESTATPVKSKANPFRRSVAARVVSTGCSACDMELGASGNPIFDIERFGITVVASPRFADAPVVTDRLPKACRALFAAMKQ